MGLIFVITVLFFIVALGLLSIGVVLRKKTPLKGHCGSAGHGSTEHVCEACSCDKVRAR